MDEKLPPSQESAPLTERAAKLLSEADQLRTSLIQNILESRRLIDQLDELRAAMSLGNCDLRGMDLRDLETAAVLTALESANGNRTHAAQVLGISVRTIQRKLKSLGWLDGAPDSNGHAHQQAS